MNYADRIKDTTTTTGTGTITLAGAPPSGFQSFAAGLTASSSVPYCIAGQTGSEWEVGNGVLLTGTTLSRSPTASSNAGSLVNFSAGTKDVFCTLSAASAKLGLVDPSDIGFDIVLCAGQSNMSGYGSTADAAIDCADGRVYKFGCLSSDSATYQTIISGVEPMINISAGSTLGPAGAFGKAYAASLPTNRRVLLVPVSIGGTSLVSGTPRWNSGTPGGDLYESAITQSNAAVAAAVLLCPNSRFAGVIWQQGELDGDGVVTQAVYATALKALIAGFRGRITGASGSFFIIGSMVPAAVSGNAGYVPIDLAHKQVAVEVSKCAFAQGPSGMTGDNLHYTPAGMRVQGARLGLAVRTAMAYTAAPLTASAVIATVSSSSGVTGTPVTVTVTTNNPLTGAQSESVALTCNIAGTFSTTPVTLNASTASVTATFTPSTTGSATITGTATGTPTLTAGTVSYTSTAAATVPATMSAPVATGGDTTAALTWTLPATGGAALTSVTVTPYISTTAQTAQTFGAASTGGTVTGLTNSTAYTFKVHASNSVGAGVDSPASNSVTPAAVVATLRLINLTGITEAGPPYVYTGGGATGYTTQALLNVAMQSGVNGEIVLQKTSSSNADSLLCGMDTSSAAMDYSGIDYGLVNNSEYNIYMNGSAAGNENSVVPLANDYIRFKRVGATMTAAVSTDATTYTTIKTWTVSTGVLYFHATTSNAPVFKLISSSGLA